MIRFGFAICLSSVQTAPCPLRERYNSADIFRRYRHEDASEVISGPAMSATGAFVPVAVASPSDRLGSRGSLLDGYQAFDLHHSSFLSNRSLSSSHSSARAFR